MGVSVGEYVKFGVLVVLVVGVVYGRGVVIGVWVLLCRVLVRAGSLRVRVDGGSWWRWRVGLGCGCWLVVCGCWEW